MRGPLGGLVDSSPWQAGWPRRQRYRGEPFFVLFCAVRMGAAVVVWGPLYCETVQDPPHLSTPSLLSHKTTVTQSHTPVHPSPVPDQLGACSVL